MNNVRIESSEPPESLVKALANRDAAIWIGTGFDSAPEDISRVQALLGLPWKLALLESTSRQLLPAIEAQNATRQPLDHIRGFLHIVAADPDGIQLPPRALPIYLLNGREDPHAPPEAVSLGRLATTRRRLNMLKALVLAKPKTLVIVPNGCEALLEDLIALWQDESFRSLPVLIGATPKDEINVDNWLRERSSPPAVDHWTQGFQAAVDALCRRMTVELPDGRLIIAQKDKLGRIANIEITDAELPERPVLEDYDIIRASDLPQIPPGDLTREQIEGFFTRSSDSWIPYAAGVPWPRDKELISRLKKSLLQVEQEGPSHNLLLTIVSEPGAGGTTLARALAYEAARDGYPTLVARPNLSQPEPLDLSRFLFRMHALTQESCGRGKDPTPPDAPQETESFEVPVLIVFDAHHWMGRSAELRSFVSSLTRDGRPAVVLSVVDPNSPADLSRTSRTRQLTYLKHEMSLESALQLGNHLNRFLKLFNRDKTTAQWRDFWEAHRPDHITSTISHFWIALEFWLKGQLDLSESIQSWLYRSFTSAEIPDSVRVIVLEIAALGIERQPIPEELIPSDPSLNLPVSVILEEVRQAVPGLALVREGSGSTKLWAIAHDTLGRYLITSVFLDRTMLDRLKLGDASDPVGLRLLLLSRIATRPSLALQPFRRLALDFPVRILKVDADGNQEFLPHWRNALDILRSMPAGIRQASRTFNHHLAVSLRRVAKQREFLLPLPEKRTVLLESIDRIEYALLQLPPSPDEESDLNLYNSLALAYQDIADIERESGSDASVIDAYRAKATEATRQAFQYDPSNSYVIETTAKNLIQNGELHPDDAVASGTEALGYIYQALVLHRAEFRQVELARLANRALRLLRSDTTGTSVDRLRRSRNPLGILAQAWLALTAEIDDLGDVALAQLPESNVRAALAVLEGAAQGASWMLLRFQYDLVCVCSPYDFSYQIRLLDELLGTPYRMPLQARLEHSILLHQQGRAFEANRSFRSLRQDLTKFESFVEVPPRLHWLYAPGTRVKRIVQARAVEARGARSMAKVRELSDELVPFIPQEFGIQHMRPGEVLSANVSFGRMGPFLKPPH